MRKGLTTVVIAVFSASMGLLAACDRPPSPEQVPEWSPADHDRAEENAKQQAAPAGSARSAAQQSALVEAAWKSQCLRCHGATGRGDGPEGPMNQTPDLTSGDWQAKSSDADIAAVIRGGKNKMPKFDLPDAVTAGLVARIRAARGK